MAAAHSGGTNIQEGNYTVMSYNLQLAAASGSQDLLNISIPSSGAELVQAIGCVTTAGTVTTSATLNTVALETSAGTLLTDAVVFDNVAADGAKISWTPVAGIAAGPRGEVIRLKLTEIGTINAGAYVTVTAIWGL